MPVTVIYVHFILSVSVTFGHFILFINVTHVPPTLLQLLPMFILPCLLLYLYAFHLICYLYLHAFYSAVTIIYLPLLVVILYIPSALLSLLAISLLPCMV